MLGKQNLTKDSKDDLFSACLKGHTETVQLLIENGADINAATRNGLTPLYRACLWGHTEIVKLLIENGADVNAATRNGETPLYLACLKGHTGYTEIVKLLIENGADVNAIPNGLTPLYLACLWGHTEIVKLLIDSISLQDFAAAKPDFIRNNKEFSNFWDKKVEKINYLLESKILGCKNSSEKTLDKISLAENGSLLHLSFRSFFKSLNPDNIKNKVDRQLDVTCSGLKNCA